ncbi:50S ribosomal protein L11 [Candidatus Woesearchaeota archaeon CG11_big_fil_rev_8_21_14_0_20_43_8]|nr:MAG: 50S ribosomal protein L11 [Candidatus Woesearchaeota archaeon CG11_big_fil_rev_8_21_14_0_20_43_8]PIO04969.1 MAG: 50S ribosomal protein L11 [Candidatus Woesearchaeota archaeon CG08_land_8_20_14_0_20_43_7]
MATESVQVLIEGGKATAAPPLGPALGPLGVNIGKVVADINKKTESFKGMQVPVKVEVDKDTKDYTITIGTPPAASLILKEAGVQKGAGNPLTDKVADLRIEQVIKISKMKEDALLGRDTKARVKEIIGTCNSMGIMVEGVPAVEAIKLVNEGKFDEEIEQEKTEISAEEQKEQAEERRKLAEDMEKRRAEYEAKAKAVLASMSGKTNKDIRAKMVEEGIPEKIINEHAPVEKKEAPKKA